MPSIPQNLNVLLGAGVFGIVCAATLYVVEHYRQDRRRHAMARDLARLDTEMAILRQELNSLLALQKQKTSKRGKRTSKKAESLISSSTTTEDYSSAVDADSSDLEFYDVSDDEVDATSTVNLDKELVEIDLKLEENNLEQLQATLAKLQNLCIEYPENPQLLWRLGKAHYKIFEKTEEQDHLRMGIEACTLALNFKPELANVHKWLAILVGSRTKFQPIKEKILDGHLFKKHVDAALELDPVDATLHHMLGRFSYDIAELKWYERKVAAALFAEPPSSTYEEALEHFKKADKLSAKEWKENKLCMAKCMIKMGLIEEAVKILEVANMTENGVDEEVDKEVKELLNKYK